MIKIAIVEDEKESAELLKGHIDRYCKENDEEAQVVCFSDGIDIVSEYTSGFDVILLDIVMKHMKGMQTAEYIRKIDDKVMIIFITSQAQYAVDGYSVNALSYLLKPVDYFAFSRELKRCFDKIKSERDYYVSFFTENGMDRIEVGKITYIESRGHIMIVHTVKKLFSVYQTMKNIETMLPADRFVRCNNCYLVNLAYVEGMHGDYCIVAGEELKISRPKRKSFIDSLTVYCALK